MNRTAIYTTIYPGMERFQTDWCSSLKSQDHRGFDVWIGADRIETETVSRLLGQNFNIHFVTASDEDTPASLRCRILKMMVTNYDVIILTDSDDILEPTRVTAALHGLAGADIHGCALGLVDRDGRDLEIYFGLIDNEDPYEILPKNNYLGFSNTAWRSEALRRCLPAPKQCVALDWLLATRAWGNGARISFDRTIRMRYRQYDENLARVVPPFSTEGIVRAATVVTKHFQLATTAESGLRAPRRKLLYEAASRVEKFWNFISASGESLDAYVTALNQLPPHRFWWLTVAHPALETIWNS